MEEFRARLITDIRNRFRGRNELREYEKAEKYVLRETENYLQSIIGKTLVDFGLPLAHPNLELLIQMRSDEQNFVDEEQARQELRANVLKFNNGQREVFDRVVGKVLANFSTASILGEPPSGDAGNEEEGSFN